jgi:hypothetical protein
MKNILMVSMLLLLVSTASYAMQPSLLFGVRDGAAFGIMADQYLGANAGLRFGVEANSSDRPLILFAGGRFYLTHLGKRSSLGLGVGVVNYSGGNSSDTGLSLSLIFDRVFDGAPRLFIESGLDLGSKTKLQLQMGYKF